MSAEHLSLAKPCPAPDRQGRHEVYSRGKVEFTRGTHCRACGASDVSEFELMEAVLACVKQWHSALNNPETTVVRLGECQNAMLATYEALQRWRLEHDFPDGAFVTLIQRGGPIGGGPKR